MFRPWRRPKLERAFRRWASFLSPAAGPIRPSAIRPGVRSAPRPYRDTIVWYASIISVAAALDVGVKQRRRKHWDVAIAEAEAALQMSPEQVNALKASILRPQNLDPPQTPSSPPEVEEQLPSTRTDLQTSKAFSKSTTINELFPNQSPRIQSSSSSSRTPQRLEPLPHSIYSPRSQSKTSTAGWTTKKFARTEFSVAKLCARLMNEVIDDPAHGRIVQRVFKSANYRLKSSRHIEPLEAYQIQSLEYPMYETFDPKTTDHLQHQLCKSLHIIFAKYTSGRWDKAKMLREIVRSLMTSAAPPNVFVFSILISRFSRLKLYGLANDVIACMRESLVRHDEISVSTLLGHYIRQHSYKPFHHLVQQIQGLEGGLMLADPNLMNTEAQDTDTLAVRVCKNKLIQKFPLNEKLAHQIIFGYLLFRKEDLAMTWLEEARRQSVHFDAQFNGTLLKYAYQNRNWLEVDKQWNQIYTQLVDPSVDGPISRQQEQFAFHYVLKADRKRRDSTKFEFHLQLALSRGWSAKALLSSPKSGAAGLFENRYLFDAKRKRKLHILERRVDNMARILHHLANQIVALAPYKVSQVTLTIALQEPSLYSQLLADLDISQLKSEETYQLPLHQSSHDESDHRIEAAQSQSTENEPTGIRGSHLSAKRLEKSPSIPRIRVVASYHKTNAQAEETSNEKAPVHSHGQNGTWQLDYPIREGYI